MDHFLKILLADDDPDEHYLLKEGLINVYPNHDLRFVDHGSNVLSAVRNVLPDIIFLDYNMPGCDGTQCLDLIKADAGLRHIPIIMYSTSSAQISLNRCYNRGAARYLLKPVDYIGIFKGLAFVLELYYNFKLVQPLFEDFLIDTSRLK